MAWEEAEAGAAEAARQRAAPAWLVGLLARFTVERERWVLWLPVVIGCGIGLYFGLTVEPPLWLGPAGLALALAALGLAVRSGRMRLAAGILVAFALGFAAAEFEAWHVAAPVLERRLGPVTVEGRVVEIDPLPEGLRVVVEPSLIQRLDPARLPARLRIRIDRGGDAVVPGDWFRVRAILLPPPEPSMPGAYDFQRRAYFDRLGAVGFAVGPLSLEAPPPGEGPARWRLMVSALRAAMTERIAAALPGRTGAIAAALMTGETHAIPPDDAQAFRDAGLAHILVIAGLHMGMVAGLVFFACRAGLALVPPLALRFPTKKWAAAAALLVTFGYMLLSGATVSSRRSFVMTGLVLLAVLVDRLHLSARSIAYAAIAIMLVDPLGVTGPSFQMSFSAVGGLIAFYEAFRGPLGAFHARAGLAGRVGLYLLGICLTTLIGTVATTPFTIYHVHRNRTNNANSICYV